MVASISATPARSGLGIIRPTRIAILLGSDLPVSDYLSDIFSPLKIEVIPSSSLDSNNKKKEEDEGGFVNYDIIGLMGAPKDFLLLRGALRKMMEGCVVLAFAPKAHFNQAKNYLKVANAVVFCEAESDDWLKKASSVIFHFFESLVLPSLLNIDIADVRNIAKGIGLAFNESDDSADKIISNLPKACLVARSALLHFSCKEEVKLKEIYSISKTIAQKQGVEIPDEEIETHKDALKLIRRLNVKMGIRIREGRKNSQDCSCYYYHHDKNALSKRISMTAILFGI